MLARWHLKDGMILDEKVAGEGRRPASVLREMANVIQVAREHGNLIIIKDQQTDGAPSLVPFESVVRVELVRESDEEDMTVGFRYA